VAFSAAFMIAAIAVSVAVSRTLEPPARRALRSLLGARAAVAAPPARRPALP
jgi:hypothetical protein